MRRRELRVGTSGWVYKDWNGVFYPEGLPARDRLAHYASHFDMVEINATHYRLASERAAAAWQATVPEGFVFVAKGSQFITHRLKLKNCEGALERFFAPLAPLTAMQVVLWQLPAAAPRDLERVDRFLALLPREHAGHRLRHVFEPRDPWWWSDEVRALLSKHHVAFCCVSHPALPADVVETSDLVYLRFHGLGEKPYLYDYRDDELAPWVERLAPQLDRRDVYVAFNNDWHGHAITNARRFLELMHEARAPARALTRTTKAAARTTRQRSRGS
ncbi:DUF72 domain-containing protein [Sandaracinus amylolyticus]|uniref:DUF72 domain-containing protein n=1 Tax=Sandaracinus amylolyticus TaxID=927083 RepID=A0A0F6YKH4_9BACT|nr:DUF72 domain-containing protein [Sandaracinus amylolyticus]AKF07285.1 Hypothetical protein DB32_004434 [Sandaracinus amylolyticus]